uniref:acid phosphatase n=1 Tax=Riptortus pedestris TaxID=329032 RepID=R4WD33_RIPPE|nr:acid phosphatase-1 [Riptortus pedestris]
MKILIFPKTYFICLTFYFYSAFADNEDVFNKAGPVIFANILYRHGARTPAEPYPNDPYKNESIYWPIGWGQLTNLGKLQHYKLGQWFRNRYEHLLPEGKYSPSLIYIQSTDMDRTIMSALSNLAGLFPPDNAEEWFNKIPWQPIPVHTTPEKLDKVLAMKYPCPKFEAEYRALLKSKEIMEFNKRHQELYDYVAKHTGLVVDGPVQLEYLYSTLLIEAMNNYTLPNWTEKVFPDKLREVSAFSFGLYTYNKHLQRLKNGPLLKDMIQHMDEKINGKLDPNRNLWVYSAHDTTVANMLNTLGVFDPHPPPFTATVLLELRKNINDEYSVTVLYKNSTENEPVLLTVPGCTAACPLDKFKALLQDVIPVDWDSECHSHQLFDLTSDQPYNSLAIFEETEILENPWPKYFYWTKKYSRTKNI